MTAPVPPTGWRLWLAGSRPKTWPAGIVPVLVGTGAAIHADRYVWDRALLALVVGLFLQIGVNYANDYSDGIRGTDKNRVGPLRLTASELATPGLVKLAAFGCFGIAGIAGLVLALLAAPWLILVGVACIAAAWFYTGGKRPYGYAGFGELAVFIFFGVVATVGTTFVQVEAITLAALLASVGVGLLAVALLITNNLRDIPTDAATGKHTLAVRLGDSSTRIFYAAAVLIPFLVLVPLAFANVWVLIALVGLLAARGPVMKVMNGASGVNLIPVLKGTGQLQLVYGLLLAIGLAL